MQTYLAATYPKRRFGLIAAGGDLTIRTIYGKGYDPPDSGVAVMPWKDLAAGLKELSDTLLAPYPNFRFYYIDSNAHVFLDNTALGATVVSGVKLADWIDDMASGAPGWTNVSP